MKTWQNESGIDRLIRAVVGLILLALAYYSLSGVWSIVAYILAAVTLFTALTGFCALYKPFGISTIKKDKPQDNPPVMPNDNNSDDNNNQQ